MTYQDVYAVVSITEATAVRRALPTVTAQSGIERCRAESRELPAFWMCCGQQDSLVSAACIRFRKMLLSAGAALTWEDGPGEHDLVYWDQHLESAFRFLADHV